MVYVIENWLEMIPAHSFISLLRTHYINDCNQWLKYEATFRL